jgi:hypothetical protein
VTGEDIRPVDAAQLVRIGEHAQLAADMAKRHRIIVQVEADVGRFADRHHDMLEHRRRVGGQCEQVRPFLVEYRAHGALGLIRAAPADLGSRVRRPWRRAG